MDLLLTLTLIVICGQTHLVISYSTPTANANLTRKENNPTTLLVKYMPSMANLSSHAQKPPKNDTSAMPSPSSQVQKPPTSNTLPTTNPFSQTQNLPTNVTLPTSQTKNLQTNSTKTTSKSTNVTQTTTKPPSQTLKPRTNDTPTPEKPPSETQKPPTNDTPTTAKSSFQTQTSLTTVSQTTAKPASQTRTPQTIDTQTKAKPSSQKQNASTKDTQKTSKPISQTLNPKQILQSQKPPTVDTSTTEKASLLTNKPHGNDTPSMAKRTSQMQMPTIKDTAPMTKTTSQTQETQTNDTTPKTKPTSQTQKTQTNDTAPTVKQTSQTQKPPTVDTETTEKPSWHTQKSPTNETLPTDEPNPPTKFPQTKDTTPTGKPTLQSPKPLTSNKPTMTKPSSQTQTSPTNDTRLPTRKETSQTQKPQTNAKPKTTKQTSYTQKPPTNDTTTAKSTSQTQKPPTKTTKTMAEPSLQTQKSQKNDTPPTTKPTLQTHKPQSNDTAPTAKPTLQTRKPPRNETIPMVNVTSISCTENGKECHHIVNARCNNQFRKCECSYGYIVDAATCNAVTAAKKLPTALPALETKKVGLDFAIEVGNDLTKFDVDLTDPNSPKYKEFKHSFETKLISVFNDTKGYSSIEVTGFRKGSIIADYRLILNSFDVAKNALSFIKATVVSRITNISPIQNLPVNKQFVQNIMEEKLKTYSSGCEAFSKDICPVGFTCKTNSITHKHYCENLCIKDDKPLCGDKGECYVDAVNYTARCSCIISDGYVYHGEHCEHKTEKLKMNSKYIIAIGTGCGGALLLITVVFVICFVRLKRTKSKSPIDDKDTQFTSMGMMDIRRDRFGGQRESFYAQRKNTIENEYHSGLPNQDIKYLQGREHKIYKDEKGDEAYIYQPSSNRSSVGSELSVGPTVYDYIDTDTKFEIQRPNVRLGHLNKF